MKVRLFLKVENCVKGVRDKILKFYYEITDRKRFTIRKYDMIFSLGENCYTAIFLKSEGIRKFSAPFDWVSNSDFVSRFDIFLNEFKDFINKEDFEFVEKRGGGEPKDVYYNKRTGMMHPHDFPFDGDFSQTYIKVKEKYDRRISRVTENIKNGKSALLVYMSLANEIDNKYNDEDIVRTVQKAKEKYKNSNIDVLYIKHDENMKNGEFEIKEINKNVIMAKCFNRLSYSETEKIGNRKNVLRILHFFKCK